MHSIKENTREYADFSRISSRGGVEQRPKDGYALFQLIMLHTRPTTNMKWFRVHTLVE